MIFLKHIYHFVMARLGNAIYRHPSREIFVLGVTGTKGKTTVLELINTGLEAAGRKTALLSSVYLKIAGDRKKNLTDNTMPGRFFIQRFLSQAVGAGCDYALLEATSEGVRQHRHRFIDFDAALFLNLHPEHIEAHGSYEKYRAAKVKFFSYVAKRSKKATKFFFINQDNLSSGFFTDVVSGKGRIFYFSKDYFVRTKLKGRKSSLGRWLSNEMNLENAAAATAFLESQQISWDKIRKALKSYKGLPGRMDVAQERPFRVVIDYAHTAESLRKVYQALGNQKPKTKNQKLICVLGSCGGGRDKWKRPELGKIAAEYCREIILTNEDPYDENPLQILEDISNGFSQTLTPVPSNLKPYKILDRREAIRKAISLAKRGDTVIITGKGSEQWIHIAGGKKVPWDERRVVEEILRMK